MRNISVFFTILFIVSGLFMGFRVISFTTGAPTNASGSPGNNNMTCVQCHASNNNVKLNWITSTELADGYVPGTQYNMEAKADKVGCAKFGFLITIEKPDGTKAGFPIVTDAVRTQIVSTNYITHTADGTVGQGEITWPFKWSAPPMPMGTVTLYGAFVGANGDNQNSGDVVYVSKKEVILYGTAGVAAASASDGNKLYVYPNPADTEINLHLGSDVKDPLLRIYDPTGKIVKEIFWQSANQMKVDVSSLPNGTYILYMGWENDFVITRVLVRR